MKDKSPFRQLAVPEYVREFQDLLSPTAELSFFEQCLIESAYEISCLSHFDDDELKAIKNTARVAYQIMQDAAHRTFESVIAPFVFNAERVSRLLIRGWESRKDAFEKRDLDERLLAFLLFYKTMYEGIMPILFAPIVGSMAIISGKGNRNAYTLTQDGKASLSQLQRIEYEWPSQKKQLTEGLNNHLRNSFAHECYRLLDGGKIELWDIDPRTGNYSWGPYTFTEEMLIDACERLWRNVLGTINAWILFSMNNRKIITQGQYYESLPIAPDPLRTEEIKALSEQILSQRGFDTIFFEIDSQQMTLTLRCQLKGVDQESEMLVQAEQNVRKFRIEMKYYEVPIIDQLIGAFQIMRHHIRKDFEFIATVLSSKDTEIGEVRGHTKQFQQYAGKKLPSISEFRKELSVDTVGTATTWMLEEAPPQEF